MPKDSFNQQLPSLPAPEVYVDPESDRMRALGAYLGALCCGRLPVADAARKYITHLQPGMDGIHTTSLRIGPDELPMTLSISWKDEAFPEHPNPSPTSPDHVPKLLDSRDSRVGFCFFDSTHTPQWLQRRHVVIFARSEEPSGMRPSLDAESEPTEPDMNRVFAFEVSWATAGINFRTGRVDAQLRIERITHPDHQVKGHDPDYVRERLQQPLTISIAVESPEQAVAILEHIAANHVIEWVVGWISNFFAIHSSDFRDSQPGVFMARYIANLEAARTRGDE